MPQFFNHDIELQVAAGPQLADPMNEDVLNDALPIEPVAINRCLSAINHIIDTYGSGLFNEQSYALPRLRVAELAISTHEVEGVHPKAMPYVHLEVPVGEFAQRAEWSAVAVFNYGDAKLTNCITWLKDDTIMATWYGADTDSKYLSNETANTLASDLESMAQETYQSYVALLDPMQT